MPGFIQFHLVDDRSRGVVTRRQSLQMSIQMRLNLPLRFGDKSKAQFVAQSSGNHAQSKCARVPKRVEDGWMGSQLVETLASPGEVI